ncbi:pali-domain-containing protein [Macrolepiota fuliginosa MF-IS2]|uniref:Pali-domain-containing protein n=1 Tax=Macrolepiota fuliginosa MF-IS2 TaxID=1400762 RepID=A0A9P5XKI4_9AGAR|nr:pali-domain-containing protein [Macrolepiota fuliginosa MF-IS2]
MGCIRPATPGFLVTLIAAALLAVVSFCVPYFKSVYFLRADIPNNGAITFGTLGYCLELSNGTTCSRPSIGYQLDINGLVGNKFKVQIPQVAVKWITYALFLHVVGLILAAISALFGLLAHVREMSMACCSTFVSGFAAGITLLAFIFDIALFFIAKARINAVGHASIGNAIWLTLAAWILLFFSGCFYAFGRCCISKRGPRSKWGTRGDQEGSGPDSRYAEQMRMDAIKSEAERKNVQAAGGGGLPAFYETVPLTGRVEGDSVYTDYKDETSDISTPTAVSHSRPQKNLTGYAPAPQGTRAVDEYYIPRPPTAASSTTYPPHTSPPTPHRQASGYAPATTGTSTYMNAPPQTTPSPANNQYLGYQDPYTATGRDYGHVAGGSSYHTAASQNQQPTSYPQYDQYNNYNSQPQPQTTHYSEPSFNPDVYNSTGILNTSSSPPVPATNTSTANPYLASSSSPYTTPSTPSQQYTPHQRQYTLGGDGYGANSVPPLPEQNSSSYYQYSGAGAASNSYPAPIDTSTAYGVLPQTSPVKGSRQPPGSTLSYSPDDAPPVYEAGSSDVAGHWGKH